MEQIVVKSEMPSNGEILLFYVDENGGNEQGVLTTVEHLENQAVQLQQDQSYVIQDISELSNDINFLESSSHNENWTDVDIKRLLIFYNDNKQSFISGTTKKIHLWTVACKTMLIGKNPNSCEAQLENLKAKYKEIYGHMQKGLLVTWPYFEMCHQVFQDVSMYSINQNEDIQIKMDIPTDSNSQPNIQNFFVMKNVNRPTVDENVLTMLKLYLKYKKNFQEDYWSRGLWETIAMEIGIEDGEYWQKRFLNYKQHYLRLFDKRRENGSEGINWPYLELFDKIFEGDENFRRKYVAEDIKPNPVPNIAFQSPIEWDNTEKTVLVKYFFDSFDEFEDPTIPNSFLWNEIGRLLDKTADTCKEKYEELKNAHLDRFIEGDYNMRIRKPIEILFDNIISKEIEAQLVKCSNKPEKLELWKTAEIDELVKFFYDNIELFKDPLCHFVCWAAICKKLNKELQTCRSEWEDLMTLYKTILNDKKEDPDMQIDWRYIELFDRIFDYGMDEMLLSGYEKVMTENKNQNSTKVGVKKVNIKLDDNKEYLSDDDESFDEGGYNKRTRRHSGDSKAFKILEYYQKNKDKFNTTKRNKHSLWEVLAKQIGISALKCSHRFRNLKQVYTAYVQREINKPEMPILWPYYPLCKKVFGYRAIKSKLKNGKLDSDDIEEWTAKEIKQLINYFSQNSDEITRTENWSNFAANIGKSENTCKEKFLELRKSFRKLKTMRTRNPDVKISWKYFNMFEQIYAQIEENKNAMEVQDGPNYVQMHLEQGQKGGPEEDDYQCIIVIPEGQDLSEIENSKIIPHNSCIELENDNANDNPKPVNMWIKRTKKRLLISYINYVRSHKGKEIIAKDMWAEIASMLPEKTPRSCRKMFLKLKAYYKEHEHDVNKQNSPYKTLMEKIMHLKPKFSKTEQNKSLTDERIYKDVPLPDSKVEQALKYYLQHIEDFVNPKFGKKYLWTELANFISEPVTKVFNKINYLKQCYDIERNEVAGTPTPFADLLKDILAKEIAIKLVIENEPKPLIDESVTELWTDDETDQLLEWYLSNLEKFKNPKYVRSYLWMEASNILNKSAIVCSKKMSEIRTQYRNMVRETPEALSSWRFLDLCQKIYGMGKKGNSHKEIVT